MIIAMRGASANDAPDSSKNSAVNSPRRATLLLRVAVHHRARVQVLDSLGQLRVGLAIEQARQAQVRKAWRVLDKDIRRYADIVNRITRWRVIT